MMDKRSGWCAMLSVAVLLLLLGCGSTTVGMLSPFTDADEQELREHLLDLRTRYRLIDSLQTYMRVQITTQEGTQEVRELLRYAYPDKLRVDALGAFSETRAVILAVEDQFTLFLLQENEAIQDRLSDQVLTDVFGVDLRISDVRSALFANPFLEGETSELRGKRTGDQFRIQRVSTRPGHWEEILLTVRDGRPLVESWKLLDRSQQTVQESYFQDYREVGGLMLPFKTVVSRPLQQTRVTFQLSQPQLHVDFGENTFRLNLSNARIRSTSP